MSTLEKILLLFLYGINLILFGMLLQDKLQDGHRRNGLWESANRYCTVIALYKDKRFLCEDKRIGKLSRYGVSFVDKQE